MFETADICQCSGPVQAQDFARLSKGFPARGGVTIVLDSMAAAMAECGAREAGE